MQRRRNILILHSGALGDFLLAWPLVLPLARTNPQSRVIVVTHASKGQLAESALRVESADIEAGWQSLFAQDGQPHGRAQQLVEGAQSIYSFICAADDVAAQNLRHWTGHVPLICVAPRPPHDYTRHATDFLVEQLKD